MSDYTTREILDAVGARSGTDEKVADLQWCGTITLRDETVEVSEVAQEGGMDEGSSIWFVVRIGDQLFRKDGYYASHYGTDWDGAFYEVKAAQKTVTVYEAA